MSDGNISEEVNENDGGFVKFVTELTLTKDSYKREKFNPLYLISMWKEPNTVNDRLTIANVLPSGIERGGFTVRV